jgi:hypothetical protein
MKKLLLFVPFLLLFVSCNNSPTGSNINKPMDSPAKSVQSSAAESKQVTKPTQKNKAGITKQDSGIIQKAEEAKNK